MNDTAKKYRFILIQAFQLPESSPYQHRSAVGPREKRLQNYDQVAILFV